MHSDRASTGRFFRTPLIEQVTLTSFGATAVVFGMAGFDSHSGPLSVPSATLLTGIAAQALGILNSPAVELIVTRSSRLISKVSLFVGLFGSVVALIAINFWRNEVLTVLILVSTFLIFYRRFPILVAITFSVITWNIYLATISSLYNCAFNLLNSSREMFIGPTIGAMAMHFAVLPIVAMAASITRAAINWIQSERSRISTQNLASLAISVTAILVSVAGIAAPLVVEKSRQLTITTKYAQFLATDDYFSIGAAFHLAAHGSPASEFARRIQLVHYASARDSIESSRTQSAVQVDAFGTERLVCFRDYATLPLDCGVFGDWRFDESGDLEDFTIDGLPVSSLFESNTFDGAPSVSLSPEGESESTVEITQYANLRGMDESRTGSDYVPRQESVAVILRVQNNTSISQRIAIIEGDDDNVWAWVADEAPPHSTTFATVRMSDTGPPIQICIDSDGQDSATCGVLSPWD